MWTGYNILTCSKSKLQVIVNTLQAGQYGVYNEQVQQPHTAQGP